MNDTDVSREDMISCIQDWFAQEYSLRGVATLYYDLRSEIDSQLEFMLEEVARTRSKAGLYEEEGETHEIDRR